jgi:multidrug resistance protein
MDDSMLKNNRNILIIALIALVNMLGYGIIIPILYAYSKKFGLTDFQNGLLFATYSVCQFISTPIIGRLSDRYGRRPMLIVSISGTAVSFFTMAFAPNAVFLFLARALDGLTAGNIPVAFAVISDLTNPEERPKAFGIVGAAFNFGFVFGPAISALTIGLGNGVPFLIAGVISVFAVALTAKYLPETNQHMGEVMKGKLIDIPKLWRTLFDENVGVTLMISHVYFLAFSCAIIYGFQPFVTEILKITPSENAIIFTIFGFIGLISQTYLVSLFSKMMGMKKSFTIATLFVSLALLIMFFSHSTVIFVGAMILLSLFNSVVQTLIPTIISQITDAKSQGSIMGLNTSYQSLGLIAGPIIGGIAASVAVPLPFIIGSFLVLVCWRLSFRLLKPGAIVESAF